MIKNSIYFPNLNGLRFVAALMVIVSHIELGKSYFGINNDFQMIKNLGKLGVTLFFVLSGFLITYLLLKEKTEKSKINLRFFYLRRILRIWPLYFFIVILSLFVLPYFRVFDMPNFQLDFDNKFEFIKVVILFLFFLTNILITIKLVPFATQTWSIGTEEQFYLIWPILINKMEKFENWFLGIIFIYNLILILLESHFLTGIKYINLLQNYFIMIQLDSLAFGALGACLLYKKKSIIDKISNNFFFFGIFFVLLASPLFDIYIIYFKKTFYAICFVIIIVNLVHNKQLSNLLENRFFFKMGEISYGLYMYHQIMIALCINCLLSLNCFSNVVLYISVFVTTILFSILSYKFLEQPFILKKRNYNI